MNLSPYTAKTWTDYSSSPALSAANVQTMDSGIAAVTAEVLALEAALPSTYQPLSAELSALVAASTGPGYAKRTGAAAWSIASSIPQSDVSGLTAALAGLQPLDSDLTAIAALTTQAFGRSLLTAVDAAAGRALLGAGTVSSVGLTAPALMTATGSPVTGAGTLALAWSGSSANLVRADGSTVAISTFQPAGSYQPLDADLTAISALATTGFVRRTAADTWAASALAAGDLPAHSTDLLTSGTLPFGRGGTGIAAPGATAGNLRWNGSAYVIDTAAYALASAIPAASSTTPAALGTAAVGTGTTWARADHVHAMPTAAQVGAVPASGGGANAMTGYLFAPGVVASSGGYQSSLEPYILNMTSGRSSRVYFGTGQRSGPATSFASTSGEKITLYDGEYAGQYNVAIGVSGSSTSRMWFGVTSNTAAAGWDFFAGGVNVLNINGIGSISMFGGDIDMGLSGRLILSRNYTGTNYTIAASDCGKLVDVGGFRVTLPSGLSTGFWCIISGTSASVIQAATNMYLRGASVSSGVNQVLRGAVVATWNGFSWCVG